MSDVLLTISLLCSGRKDTTEDCLKSLMPIRERIPSELIVVDTGCDDELREVISKYADQIIPFKWIDDFSAARNTGLDAGKGEWFMFIDDDEWLTSTDDIINFFESGIYKDYKSAAYQVKSYLNKERTISNADWTLRLFYIGDGNRFWGMIHEYPKKQGGERYYLKDIADHTGYYYETPEQKIAHTYRNIKPLEKMIEIDPTNMRWYYQLAQEYRVISNFSGMKDICLRMADALADCNTDREAVYRATFYVGAILAEEGMKDKQLARKHFELFSKDKRNNIFGQAMFYNIGAMQTLEDQKYDECIEYAKKYYEIYEQYHDDLVLQADGAGFFVQDAMWKETANGVLQAQIIAMIMSEKFEGIYDLYNTMDLTTSQMIGEFRLAVAVIDALAKHPDEEELLKIFELECNDARLNHKLDGVILGVRDESVEYFNNLASIADRVDSDFYFLYYLKAIGARNTGDKALYEKRLMEIPTDIFFTGVDILTGSKSYDELSALVDEFDELSLPDSRIGYAHMKLAEKMLSTKPADSYSEIDELLNDLLMYAVICLEFYEIYFKPEVFENRTEILPPNARVAVHLSQFMDVMNDDFRSAFAILKKTVSEWSVTKSYISKLSALYGNYVKLTM